jgi:hypothetical protein
MPRRKYKEKIGFSYKSGKAQIKWRFNIFNNRISLMISGQIILPCDFYTATLNDIRYGRFVK